jgi:hypothetical protein
MRRRSSRVDSSDARRDGLQRMAETMAKHFGVPITEIRFATYEFHNGSFWTVSYAWERRIDGGWHEEKWLPPSPRTQPPVVIPFEVSARRHDQPQHEGHERRGEQQSAEGEARGNPRSCGECSDCCNC